MSYYFCAEQKISNKVIMTKIYTFIILSLFAVGLTAQINVTDADLTATSDVTWTNDQEYLLDGYVFLEAGGKLTIEPGTIIKGAASPSTGDNASALIITRGAQIFAEGNSTQPIIFTSELDDVNDPNELTSNNKGLWGGIIILGNGVVGVDGGIENIEGIPSTEGRAQYGGTDNADNSGVLKYVSIRHGGKALEANNEINGLTLGAVGSGTTIDYIEVYANKDDGIEWFGGGVGVKHAVVSFCGDDSFDFDQSWEGKGQYWFSLQDEESNRAGEWDGSESSDLTPKVDVLVSNLTFIGGGDATTNDDGNDALRIRDAAAAKIYNSLFIDFASGAVVIDNDLEGAGDSYDRLVDGDFAFENNVFFDFQNGSTFEEIMNVDGGDFSVLESLLTSGNNSIADPAIGGISRQPDGGLDPRTSSTELNFQAAVSVGDSFFDDVSYIGAFSNGTNWALNWTALDEYGYFGDLVATSNKETEVAEFSIFPNPTNGIAQITFEAEETTSISIEVRNILGQVISTNKQSIPSGSNSAIVDFSTMQNGTYLVTISTDNGSRVTKKIIKK